MHQNWLFLHRLLDELNSIFAHARLFEVFSNTVDELIFSFLLPNDEERALKAIFLEGSMYLYFDNQVPNQSGKAMPWFKELWQSEVVNFSHHGTDRSFSLRLQNERTIVFKLYGRFSNVLTYSNGSEQPLELFRRQHKTDYQLKLSEFNRNQELEWHTLQADFIKANRQLPEVISRKLFERYDSETKMLAEGLGYLQSESKCWGLIENEKGWDLDLFSCEIQSPMEVSNKLVRQHFPKYQFLQLKASLIKERKSKLKSTQKKFTALKAKAKELENRRSYKELADLIMANLHTIKVGQETLKTLDFYTNEPIEIALKPTISPQDYASKLYKKSKNQKKEKAVIDEKIASFKAILESLNTEVEGIESSENQKALKKWSRVEKENPKRKTTSKPYWEKEIEGVLFWIGKGAKQNDQLLRLCHKEDWWFHAKDVPGSHCVARTRAALSKSQLEQMASYAASYSKASSQSLVPVIYTKRKFVRKPKGFPPGKVLVDKEDVVLVPPVKR